MQKKGLKSDNLSQEILEHQSKRQIELELMKFRETMEERGYSDDVIETKVAEVRKKLTNQVIYFLLRFAVNFLMRCAPLAELLCIRSSKSKKTLDLISLKLMHKQLQRKGRSKISLMPWESGQV